MVLLDLLLAVFLLGRWHGMVVGLGGYWLMVAIARTAGTAIGDWLAENKIVDSGLPTASLITGLTFSGVLLIWRSRPSDQGLAAAKT